MPWICIRVGILKGVAFRLACRVWQGGPCSKRIKRVQEQPLDYEVRLGVAALVASWAFALMEWDARVEAGVERGSWVGSMGVVVPCGGSTGASA